MLSYLLDARKDARVSEIGLEKQTPNSQDPTPRRWAVGHWKLGVPGREARALVRHVEEERRRAALVRERTLALFGRLTRLFAILAAHRERQRPQTRSGDLVTAFEAVAVGAVIEPAQRRVNFVQR